MTTFAAIDAAVAAVADRKEAWTGVAIPERIDILGELTQRTGRLAGDWAETAGRIKRIKPGSPALGEEWMSGPYALLESIGALQTTLRALQAGDSPIAGRRIGDRPGGRLSVEVFPWNVFDRLLLSGYHSEVWMEPGVERDDLPLTIGGAYSTGGAGRMCLILGAGNITSIPPLDILTKLFVENQVALVKPNPLTDPLVPLWEDLFAPLVSNSYLRFVTGDASEGAHLTRHAAVDTIHVTGGGATHDAIVFGRGDEGAARKARGEPEIDKPVTSELGGVGPTIVLPGPWREADFRYQAEHLVTQRLHNNGNNCVASQVLVLPEAWDGSERLVDAIRDVMRSHRPRHPYYPGTSARRRRALEGRDDVEVLGHGEAPATLIPGLSPDSGDPFFTEEVFGPVYATTSLGGDGAATFLDGAIEFGNDALSGTLGANIIAHPATLKGLGGRLDDAIAQMRYGTVGVNVWSGIGFLAPRSAWGAFPGHTPADVGSGIGMVHNALMFGRAERNVARGPFYPFPRSVLHREWHLSPKPPWFVTHRKADVVAEKLTRFAAAPRWRRLPGIVLAALRG